MEIEKTQHPCRGARGFRKQTSFVMGYGGGTDGGCGGRTEMVGWGGRHRRVAGPHTQSLNSPTRSEPNDRGISRDDFGTISEVSGIFP